MFFSTNEPKKATAPWPYKSVERWLKARVEPIRQKSDKPFYSDFNEDVFAGVL